MHAVVAAVDNRLRLRHVAELGVGIGDQLVPAAFPGLGVVFQHHAVEVGLGVQQGGMDETAAAGQRQGAQAVGEGAAREVGVAVLRCCGFQFVIYCLLRSCYRYQFVARVHAPDHSR